MSRVLALVGNRPDVCGVAAKKYAHLLQMETRGQALGWGIGFYQAGEALLRRRPLDDREVIEIAALNDISSGLLITQIRTPCVGALRTVTSALIGLLVTGVLVFAHPWLAGLPVVAMR